MADWPIQNIIQKSHALPESGYFVNSEYTAAHTKGAWVELGAATPFDCAGIDIIITAASFVGEFLTDLAMGAAGAEIVLIENIYSYERAYMEGQNYHFPLFIPAGVRLSVRQQGTYNATNRHRVKAILHGSSWNNIPTGYKVTTLGANTADSGGLSIDPGATVNTKGAWVELSSSCPVDVKGFILAIGNQNRLRVNTSYYWNIDVGIGSAGSEVVILPNYTISTYGTSDVLEPAISGFFPHPIKAGERISVRAECTHNATPNRLFDAFIYLIS